MGCELTDRDLFIAQHLRSSVHRIQAVWGHVGLSLMQKRDTLVGERSV
jgi:hypothetical protein